MRRSQSAESKSQAQIGDEIQIEHAQLENRTAEQLVTENMGLVMDEVQNEQVLTRNNNTEKSVAEKMNPFIKHMNSYVIRQCDQCLETWPSCTKHKCCVKPPFNKKQMGVSLL